MMAMFKTLKNYWFLISFIVGAIIAWTTLNADVRRHSEEIKALSKETREHHDLIIKLDTNQSLLRDYGRRLELLENH